MRSFMQAAVEPCKTSAPPDLIDVVERLSTSDANSSQIVIKSIKLKLQKIATTHGKV